MRIPILVVVAVLLSGCVCAVITTDLQNPYVLTVYWNNEVLKPDSRTGLFPVQTLDRSGAEVLVKVADESGKQITPDTYEWYLQGDLYADRCEKIFIEGTKPVGLYTVNIIVEKNRILGSENVEFLVGN